MAYARGLIPHRYQDGRAFSSSGTRGVILADYGTAVFVGDPVVHVTAGGATNPATAEATFATDVTDGTFPIFNIATAGAANVIWGVVVAVSGNRSNLENKHIPASTGGTILVARATPDLIFKVGTSATLAITDIGEATDLVAGAGSTATGYSGWTLDQAGLTTASQVYITGLYNIPGNEAADGTDAIWECTVQAIQYAINPAGVGLS
jgi:hypothetical protein